MEAEPIAADNPLTLPNVVMRPHLGSRAWNQTRR